MAATVTVKTDNMEIEIQDGLYVTFKRTMGGASGIIEGCIQQEDITPAIMQKVETLQRRATSATFDLIRTVLMSHAMEFTSPLSIVELIPAAEEAHHGA